MIPGFGRTGFGRYNLPIYTYIYTVYIYIHSLQPNNDQIDQWLTSRGYKIYFIPGISKCFDGPQFDDLFSNGLASCNGI